MRSGDRDALWRDTSEREDINDDEPCRRVGCKSWPIWIVGTSAFRTSDQYEDAVCGRHLMGYLDDFGISGRYGSFAQLERRRSPVREP